MRLVIGDHELDLRRQEIRRAGAAVHAEPQVLDLLVHLIRNRDRVVGKDELIEVIWNGRIVSDAALSSCISAARKAVGDTGERQAMIKTMHRRGFRFVGPVEEIAEAPPAEAAHEPPAAPSVATLPPPAAAPVPVAAAAAAASPTPGATATPAAAPRTERKPSVAVLPFVNLGRDPGTEYFTYGLTEDVIRLLARNRWLDVLSRHSGAAFKDRDVDARTIGAALDARYLVQGSVLISGERLRINVDLVSAESGLQLWSESYDLELADILAVQDTMARQIAAVIEPELSRIEREAAIRRPPATIDAWECYQRGFWHLWGFTKPGMAEAEAMFRRAIELDRDFARAHGALAYVRLQAAMLSEPQDRPDLLKAALDGARVAVSLDDRDCMNQCVLGRALVATGRRAEAIPALEQSVALNPSFAQGWFALADALVLEGREREGIALLDRATRLSPRDAHIWTFNAVRAMALLSLGALDEALEFAERAVQHPRASYWAHATRVACLGLLGRGDSARAARDELLARLPDYSVARARLDLVDLMHTPERAVERYIDGLRRAGVPEQPRTAGGPGAF
ncbi:MAG: winged helix-turn-helix domain-containing protein [Alphaproteobacteria bacterium]|nr:winged helix-turn-helix domain-containing protein [Alphaproteobacteria bacterium]